MRIEDYALIGDTHTAALVGKDGSIDWLCLPRFDSPACFAKLLGDESNGFWKMAPAGSVRSTKRRYRPGTMVLETEFATASGTVRVVDCMPVREEYPEIVRLVQGVSGRVKMRMDLVIRMAYGSILPWVRKADGRLAAIAGPDSLDLWSPVEVWGQDFTTVTEFTIPEGIELAFLLSWHPSHLPPARPVDGRYMVAETDRWWTEWSNRCSYNGPHKGIVDRSVITLKALTYAPTGGIVAAPTTSLPEIIGGDRNWDYRYCWLRDATFTLMSLMEAGYKEEASAWRDWLLRSVAGDPADMQIMYGPGGERSLPENEAHWLAGYEGSRPVRIGNAAAGQFQLDVYGEVVDALFMAHAAGIGDEVGPWDLRKVLTDFLETRWKEKDHGIWEVRGPKRHFTHSKVMAWVAFDRAVRTIEQLGMEGPVDRWKAVRAEVHAEVCAKGFNSGLGSFTQYYGSKELDASLLLIPLVGFLPPGDPRVVATVAAIERELIEDGLVLRYRPDSKGSVDGLPGREGAFLACSFWLADNYALTGRIKEARDLFGRLTGLANDVGLLAEEYDTPSKRMVGNFPQAFSHVALVNTAYNIEDGRALDRRRHRPHPAPTST